MKSVMDMSAEEFSALLDKAAKFKQNLWPAFIKTYVVPILGDAGITKSVQLDLCDDCAKGYMHDGPVSLPGPFSRCLECGIEQHEIFTRELTG